MLKDNGDMFVLSIIIINSIGIILGVLVGAHHHENVHKMYHNGIIHRLPIFITFCQSWLLSLSLPDAQYSIPAKSNPIHLTDTYTLQVNDTNGGVPSFFYQDDFQMKGVYSLADD